MRHTRKRSRSSKNYLKQLKKTTIKAIPQVKSGLKIVGTTVKKDAVPVVEEGLSLIYSGLATGINLGVKGVKKGVEVMKTTSQRRRRGRSQKSKRNKSKRRR